MLCCAEVLCVCVCVCVWAQWSSDPPLYQPQGGKWVEFAYSVLIPPSASLWHTLLSRSTLGSASLSCHGALWTNRSFNTEHTVCTVDHAHAQPYVNKQSQYKQPSISLPIERVTGHIGCCSDRFCMDCFNRPHPSFVMKYSPHAGELHSRRHIAMTNPASWIDRGSNFRWIWL